MTEVVLTHAPAGEVTALELWAGEPPTGALRVEPRRWWLLGPTGYDPGDDGAVAQIGGGLVRATLRGPGWRSLLMVAGVFDAEDPGFGPGAVAATVIHHVPVWIVPTAAAACDVYFPASYASGLIGLWTAAIARGLPPTPAPVMTGR